MSKQPKNRASTLQPVDVTVLGRVAGTMDPYGSGDASVWVRLADGIEPDDVVGLDVYVKPLGDA